ncbi:thiamine phosphate synthase [Thermogymnomonas acidicola]|nr:thiamine phosphate synthase [Thermogymnomonas acidicola]
MPSLEEARAVVGNLPIGTSVYCSPVFAVEAQAHGYAYVSVGTPYMSVTKRIATVCSMQNLSEAVRAVRIPVYAVGGVNLKNAAEILETGVSGLVSVSAIFSANDVRGTVRKFIEVLEGFTVDRDPFPVGLVR